MSVSSLAHVPAIDSTNAPRVCHPESVKALAVFDVNAAAASGIEALGDYLAEQVATDREFAAITAANCEKPGSMWNRFGTTWNYAGTTWSRLDGTTWSRLGTTWNYVGTTWNRLKGTTWSKLVGTTWNRLRGTTWSELAGTTWNRIKRGNSWS